MMVLVACVCLALWFGGWWLWRVLREKRRRRTFASAYAAAKRDWRNEWKP